MTPGLATVQVEVLLTLPVMGVQTTTVGHPGMVWAETLEAIAKLAKANPRIEVQNRTCSFGSLLLIPRPLIAIVVALAPNRVSDLAKNMPLMCEFKLAGGFE